MYWDFFRIRSGGSIELWVYFSKQRKLWLGMRAWAWAWARSSSSFMFREMFSTVDVNFERQPTLTTSTSTSSIDLFFGIVSRRISRTRIFIPSEKELGTRDQLLLRDLLSHFLTLSHFRFLTISLSFGLLLHETSPSLSLSLSRPFCVSVHIPLSCMAYSSSLPFSSCHQLVPDPLTRQLGYSQVLSLSLSLSYSPSLTLILSLSLSSTHSHVSTRDEWKKGLQTNERTNERSSVPSLSRFVAMISFFVFFSFQASADDKEKKVWCHEKIKKLDKIEIRDEFGQVCERKKVWYKNLNIDFLRYLSTRNVTREIKCLI